MASKTAAAPHSNAVPPSSQSKTTADTSNTDPGKEVTVKDQTPSTSEVLANSSTSSDPKIESATRDKENKPPQNQEYDRTKSVCPILLKQECPHGITGATNGKCGNYHPTWCKRHMRNGPNGKRGCNRGDKCRYFHAPLCKNGLVLKMCFNKDCKLTHIRGVRRIDDAKSSSSKPHTTAEKAALATKRKPSSGPPPQPKRSKNTDTDILPTDPKPPANKDEPVPLSQEDFLKHLAQIKADLTKEVTQDLPTLIQASLQSILGNHLPFRAQMSQPMYLPPAGQFNPEIHQQPAPPLQCYPQSYPQQGYHPQHLTQPIPFQPL